MAKAIAKEFLPPIALELSGEEAAALCGLLATEKWPRTAMQSAMLNDVWDALGEAGVQAADDTEPETAEGEDDNLPF